MAIIQFYHSSANNKNKHFLWHLQAHSLPPKGAPGLLNLWKQVVSLIGEEQQWRRNPLWVGRQQESGTCNQNDLRNGESVMRRPQTHRTVLCFHQLTAGWVRGPHTHVLPQGGGCSHSPPHQKLSKTWTAAVWQRRDSTAGQLHTALPVG